MTAPDAVRCSTRPAAAGPRPYSRAVSGLVIALAGLIIALWLLGTPPGIQGKADAVGYAVCHRISSRSFYLHGRPLPLCARCTGLYLGVMSGLGLYALSGRLRAGRLPPVRVLALLLLPGAAIAVDGLNSYLSLFAAYRPVYSPHNTLRLITGLYAGLTMITVVLPVFNANVWRAPRAQAPLDTLVELGALWAVGVGVIGVVLVQQPALLWIAALVSTAGVVIMFSLIGSVFFLTLTGREASAERARDLAIPTLAGLAFAFGLIGLIDLGRYALTGTWQGFTLFG